MAHPPCNLCGSTAGPDHPCPGVLIGKVLDGRYEIESVLGQGGMGMVFRAMQTAIKRPVALKTLHPSLAAAPQFFERFRREAEVASRLRHPNIITIFDFGKAQDGTCYFVMELVPGESLKQLVKRDGPLSLRRTINIMEQAARGLAHAHTESVVHRDIKPHNLLVSAVDGADFVKILDFGLVKALETEDEDQLTTTGQVLGTPQYMPPEQAGGEVVDRRSDLYSLGSVFYFCLTGSSPFGANTVRKALTAALTQQVPLVASRRSGAPVPRKIDEFFRKALAADRERRHQTAEEFIAEMRDAVAGLSDAELDAVPERTVVAPDPGSGSSQRGKSPSAKGSKSSPSRGNHSKPSHSKVSQSLSGAAKSKATPFPIPDAQRSLGGGTRVPPTTPDVPSLKSASVPREEDFEPTYQFRKSTITKAVLVGIPLVLLGAGGAVVVGTRTFAEEKPAPVIISVQPTARAEPSRPTGPVLVKLSSMPSGADVFNDDVLLGKTPLTTPLPRGKLHGLIFRLEGYTPVGQNLDLSTYPESTKQVDIELKPVAPKNPAPAPTPPSGGGKKKKSSDIPVFE